MKNKYYLKQLFLFTFLVTLFIGCKPSVSNKKSKEVNNTKHVSATHSIKDVKAPEFKKIIESGNAIVLDVRTPNEVAQGHIEGSSMINLYDKKFVEKINLMDKSKTICVYCRSGARSKTAAKVLKNNGFNKVCHLEGGLIGWQYSGFPLTKSTVKEDEHIKSMSLADFKKVLNTDKPVLVDFHTQWCSPCRKMAPVIDEIEKEYKNKAVVMRIDVDKSKEIAKTFKIKGVPVFILFKKGAEKWKHNGMIAKEELTSQINKEL